MKRFEKDKLVDAVSEAVKAVLEVLRSAEDAYAYELFAEIATESVDDGRKVFEACYGSGDCAPFDLMLSTGLLVYAETFRLREDAASSAELLSDELASTLKKLAEVGVPVKYVGVGFNAYGEKTRGMICTVEVKRKYCYLDCTQVESK